MITLAIIVGLETIKASETEATLLPLMLPGFMWLTLAAALIILADKTEASYRKLTDEQE